MITGVASTPTLYRPTTTAQAAGTSNAPGMAPDSYVGRSTPRVQAGGGTDGVMSTIMGFFSAIGNWFKNLWAKITGHKSNPVDDQNTAIAKAYGLLNSPDNVQAFLNEVKGYSQPGPGGFVTLGPGSTDTAGIKQLQQALTMLGATGVTQTGQYDPATQNAVKAFKRANGLHQSYKMADGTLAVNEYLDYQTYQKMQQKLTGH
jgi:hypothetical protein